jgi:hypothetical protein
MGFEPPKPVDAERDSEHDAFGEDVVDHSRVHPTGLTPVNSPVHEQQAEIVDRLNDFVEPGDDEIDETAELYEPETEESTPVEVKSPKQQALAAPAAPAVAAPAPAPTAAPAVRRSFTPRAAPGSKGKAAFTLRLDKDRHLRLRLACAVDGRSAQQLVTDALDQLLERMPDLDGLAEKAKNRG